MSILLADNLLHSNLEDTVFLDNCFNSPVSKEDFQELLSAVKPIIDLIYNGFYSDAVKSIKAKKDMLLMLPHILEGLYYSKQELSIMPCNASLGKSSTEYGYEESNSFLNQKTSLVLLNEKQHNPFGIAKTEEMNGKSNLASHNSNIKADFDTIYLNKANINPSVVIYFKEFSYPSFFNTFLLNLFEVICTSHTPRLIVIDQPGNRINQKRYIKMLNTDFPKDLEQNNNSNKIVTTNLSRQSMEKLLDQSRDNDFIILYDKSGLDKDIVTGSKVKKYNLVKSKSDMSLYQLQAYDCISNNIEGAALNLVEIEKYKDIKNEKIKKRLYKDYLIDAFIKSLESIWFEIHNPALGGNKGENKQY